MPTDSWDLEHRTCIPCLGQPNFFCWAGCTELVLADCCQQLITFNMYQRGRGNMRSKQEEDSELDAAPDGRQLHLRNVGLVAAASA
jgi:hypothetical protein